MRGLIGNFSLYLRAGEAFLGTGIFISNEVSHESGCSISVVYMFWEHEGRVRFPAPRLSAYVVGMEMIASNL
jgi:hypothetical protein